MRIIDKKEYSTCIENALGFASSDLDKIISKIGIGGTYLIGGAVRDSLINYIHSKNVFTSDYDFFVENMSSKKLREIFSDYDNVEYSRFGSPKIIFDNFEVDIVSYDNTIAENFYNLEPSLENVLLCADLSTSSIAYSLEDKKIYDFFAFDDIVNSEIELINSTSVASDLSRLVLHSDKLGFSIKPKSLEFIRDNYHENLDLEIFEYLKYKKSLDKLDLALKNLREISK